MQEGKGCVGELTLCGSFESRGNTIKGQVALSVERAGYTLPKWCFPVGRPRRRLASCDGALEGCGGVYPPGSFLGYRQGLWDWGLLAQQSGRVWQHTRGLASSASARLGPDTRTKARVQSWLGVRIPAWSGVCSSLKYGSGHRAPAGGETRKAAYRLPSTSRASR